MSSNIFNLQKFLFKQKSNPKCLYKFRQWGIEKHESVLKNNNFYFAAPDSLNDPFDCDVQYSYNNIKKENLKWFYKDAKHTGKNNSDIKNLIKKLHLNKSYVINEIEKDSFNYINNGSGVCSLSATCKNLLLWAHYANNHKGWTLAVNFKKLDNYIQKTKEELLDDKKFYLLQFKVGYFKKYHKIEFFDVHKNTENPLKIVHRFSTKGFDWKYEKEYRLAILSPFQELDDDFRILHFPDSIFEKVILGCKVTEKHEEEIKEVLRSKSIKIPLYKAKKKSFEFGLEFVKVDY